MSSLFRIENDDTAWRSFVYFFCPGLFVFPPYLSTSSFSIGGSQHLSQFVQHLIQDLGAPKSCERLQEQDSATSVRHRMKEGKSMSYINLDFIHVVRIYARHDGTWSDRGGGLPTT